MIVSEINNDRQVEKKQDSCFEIDVGPRRFFKVFDKKDKNRIGYKVWRVGMKHEGCFEIAAGSNRPVYTRDTRGFK